MSDDVEELARTIYVETHDSSPNASWNWANLADSDKEVWRTRARAVMPRDGRWKPDLGLLTDEEAMRIAQGLPFPSALRLAALTLTQAGKGKNWSAGTKHTTKHVRATVAWTADEIIAYADELEAKEAESKEREELQALIATGLSGIVASDRRLQVLAGAIMEQGWRKRDA